MTVERLVRAVLLALVASLLTAAPAGAFTPPELYVRLQRADITHEPASDWIPLAAAPQLDYIGGFQIGYRLQPTGTPTNFQAAALSITGVPDGQPTQPSNLPPYCVGKAGDAGTITPVGSELQFEGDGRYSFSVSVGPDTGPAACRARRRPHRSPSTSMWLRGRAHRRAGDRAAARDGHHLPRARHVDLRQPRRGRRRR